MRIVVTGAAGFIGSHTCERLSAHGHEVVGVDSFDDYLYPSDVKRRTAGEIASLPGFRLVEANIRDPQAVADVIDSQVDVVCHLAALAGVRPSLVDPLRYLRTNVEGTGVIIERMRVAGVRRLVFASSSSVYGARDDLTPFSEDDPCLRPASPYAATKRMNELQLSTYRDLFGIGVFALRYFTVYGPRQRPDMAISKFVDAVAHDRPITMYGDGSSRRDYTFIDDIVTGTTAAIDRVREGDYEIVNLGGTRTISLADLISLVERIVGRPAKIDRQPNQPGDVPLTYANVDRARALLAYEPSTPPESGIERYWRWVSSRA